MGKSVGVGSRWLAAVVGGFVCALAAVGAAGAPPAAVATVKVVDLPAEAAPGSSFRLSVQTHLEAGWHVNAHKPADAFLIPTELSFEAADGLKVDEPSYPDPLTHKFAFSEQALLVYQDGFRIGVPVAVAADAAPGVHKLSGSLRYQACNDETCLPPKNVPVSVEIKVGVAPARSGAVVPSGGGQEGSGTMTASAGGVDVGGMVVKHGYGLAFAFIFLMGLGLNLTPCVYPIIPITVSYFAGQGSKSKRETMSLAALYVLGMALTYSVLGVFAAASGRVFGSAMQSPLVPVLVAAMMVALATSMFGLWEFGVPGFLATRVGGSSQGGVGAFAMGLTMGIVAAPCVGPFVAALFTYVAHEANLALGFGMFFVLALGLGVPYLFLGTFSSLLHALPRSGEWMVWVRKVFGFILLGMALYFLKPRLGPTPFWYGLALVALAAAVYLGLVDRTGDARPSFVVKKRVLGAVFAAAAVVFAVLPNLGQGSGIVWNEYTRARLNAARKEGRPVVVDFTASWCVPCQELEHKTFHNPTVVEAAQHVVALKADASTGGSEDVKAAQEMLAIAGYPTVVFFDCRGKEMEDLRVLGFVPPDEFRRKLESASSCAKTGAAAAAAAGG